MLRSPDTKVKILFQFYLLKACILGENILSNFIILTNVKVDDSQHIENDIEPKSDCQNYQDAF